MFTRLAASLAVCLIALFLPNAALAAEAQANDAKSAPPAISDDTQACLGCHESATPGIVADWRTSRMARTTPARALEGPKDQRRISAGLEAVPAGYRQVVVGCAECHTLRAGHHPGTWDHEGFQVHTVVSPADCATCHPVERNEYAQNLMSHAWKNLTGNPLYGELMRQVNGVQKVDGKGRVSLLEPTAHDQQESCLFCHGTEVKVSGVVKAVSPDFGEMSFPRLTGWPNRGVGRKNPDGTMGSCTPCHSRHQFSMALARKPAACAQCHKGPDVPAYKVYQVSKHGALYQGQGAEWDFDALPWVMGRDFSAPTCAACHISQVNDGQGVIKARRTHRMNDRLWWRLLGLIYSHPHPKDPDTTKIKSPDGLSLPTALNGQVATKFLIGKNEQKARQGRMRSLCLGCHSSQWVDGQFARLEASIRSSDAETLAATRLVQRIWKLGLAQGPPQASPFDEYIERVWVESWLFYANSGRLASAMMGADLGVFEGGRWQEALTVHRLHDWIEAREKKAKP